MATGFDLLMGAKVEVGKWQLSLIELVTLSPDSSEEVHAFRVADWSISRCSLLSGRVAPITDQSMQYPRLCDGFASAFVSLVAKSRKLLFVRLLIAWHREVTAACL